MSSWITCDRVDEVQPWRAAADKRGAWATSSDTARAVRAWAAHWSAVTRSSAQSLAGHWVDPGVRLRADEVRGAVLFFSGAVS